MSATDAKVIDRVAKLLAQAEDKGVTPEEADAFAAKAEELMIRHAINAAQIAAHNGTKVDPIERKYIYFSGIFSTADRWMSNRVGEAFGFKVLQGKSGPRHYSVWIGFVSEMEQAEVLVASLLIQSRRALEPQARSWKNYGYSKQELYVARRSFIEGFGGTVAKRIADTRKRVTDEVAESDDSLLPVLASREQQVEVAFAQMYPQLRKGRAVRRSYDPVGGIAGSVAGASADIGQPGLRSRRAIGR